MKMTKMGMKELRNECHQQDNPADAMQLIRDDLQQRPWASAADVCRSLRAAGLEMPTDVAGALLAAIKTG